MADEKPNPVTPEDDSKKDTVRINLPPGLGRAVTGAPPGPAPTIKLRPAQPAAADEEAKKETAVMGRPVAPPQAKADTSRVAVPAAKPAAAEMPRPTVKLRREEEPAPAAPAAAPAAPAQPVAAGPAVAVAPSGLDMGLAIASAVLSLVVLVYLIVVASS